MKYFLIFALIFFQGGEKIAIKNPWIRPAPEKFNTAFYCTIKNNSNEPIKKAT
jgi:copper(I)-binding protein